MTDKDAGVEILYLRSGGNHAKKRKAIRVSKVVTMLNRTHTKNAMTSQKMRNQCTYYA
jgi:hypothetical protein